MALLGSEHSLRFVLWRTNTATTMGFLKKLKFWRQLTSKKTRPGEKRNGGQTSRTLKEQDALHSLDDSIVVQDTQLLDGSRVLEDQQVQQGPQFLQDPQGSTEDPRSCDAATITVDPTTVEACVSTEDPRNCDAATMTVDPPTVEACVFTEDPRCCDATTMTVDPTKVDACVHQGSKDFQCVNNDCGSHCHVC